MNKADKISVTDPRTEMNPMRSIVLCGLLALVTATAQVTLTKEEKRVRVDIDGKPFGELYFGEDVSKPAFFPLRSASGKIVTRQFPMVQETDGTKDHLHHRGVWLGYIDINKNNFWENEFSYTNRKNMGKMVAKAVHPGKSGGKTGTIHMMIDWIGVDGTKMLTEERTMTFHSDPKLRIVDFDATLTADVQAVFGDDKDGAFGVRMHDKLTEKTGTGTITNSDGMKKMKDAWGKPAKWLDYSGTLEGEEVGIAILEHPGSYHAPTRWHARDYGLVSANPFADKAYDPSQPERITTLKAGEKVRLRYRLVVHPKTDSAEIEKWWQAWSKTK